MGKRVSVQTPKGFRDALPKEAMERSLITDKMAGVFRRFGFIPLETPAVEYASLLEGKYGEEERLIFKFEDRGGRMLALRFDQTVPLARVMAQYPGKLPEPFRRYQIQPNWRAEKPQAGRYREFTQCDFDIVGSGSPLADAEVVAVVVSVLEELGFRKYHLLFNDRRVLTEMIAKSGIKKDLEAPTVRILDKLEKIGEEEAVSELVGAGIAPTKIEVLMQLLGRRPVLPKSKIAEISLDSIDEITNNLKYFGVPRTKVLYTPTLARGLDYYTGMILEVVIEGYERGSVGGGGRYDGLLGMFSGKPAPAVGFSFGLERVHEAMQNLHLLPEKSQTTKVLVTVFGKELAGASIRVASLLRRSGINTELRLTTSEKLDKQVRYADKQGIPFIVIIGPDESKADSVTLKNLNSGQQDLVPLDALPERLLA